MTLLFKAKRLLLVAILFVACALETKAGDIITATVLISSTTATNLNGTNAASITIDSDTRIWTNSVTSAATQILASTNASTAVSRLLAHLRAYPFSGVSTSSTNNGVVLTGAEGAALSITISNSWATVAYRTNTAGVALLMRGPRAAQPAFERAVTDDRIPDGLNNAATNVVNANAASMINFVDTSETQTIGGAKTFSSAVTVPAEAYDATGWNNDLSAPTKDDVRDKIESIISGDLVAADIDTSAEIISIVTDETGTGALVFSTSPTLVTPVLGVATATTLDTGQGANELYDMDQNVLTTSDVTHNSLTATAHASIGTYLQFSHAAQTADSAVTNFVANFTGAAYRTITAAADVNFIQSTNRAAVRSVVIFVDANGADRGLSVNASWKKLSTFHTVLTNGTIGIISLTTKGTAETDVFAAYSVAQ